MKPKKLVTVLTLMAASLGSSAWAQADKFSDRPVKLIVPFAAGGGVDNAARVLAHQLQNQLGTPVVVENRSGASGTVGGKAVQTAPADGNTLLFSAATHVLAKQVLRHPPYDPQADFAPVARVGEAPLMLVAAPNLEYKNLKELMAAARQQPDRFTAGIPAAGAPSHLATLLLAKQAGVSFTFVAYRGTQPALTDVAGGHTALLLDSMISVLPLAKGGRVKPMAITAAKRSALAPEVPTAKESGYPEVIYSSWYGVWAPKGTPPERIKRLNTAINAAVAEQAKAGAWANLGIEPVSESVEQFTRFIASDVAQGAELLKSAGFQPE